MKKLLLAFILLTSISASSFAVIDDPQAYWMHRIEESTTLEHFQKECQLRHQIEQQTMQKELLRLQNEEARTQLERQIALERMKTNLLRAQAENNLLVQLGQLNINNNQNTQETRNTLRDLVGQLQLLIPAH